MTKDAAIAKMQSARYRAVHGRFTVSLTEFDEWLTDLTAPPVEENLPTHEGLWLEWLCDPSWPLKDGTWSPRPVEFRDGKPLRCVPGRWIPCPPPPAPAERKETDHAEIGDGRFTEQELAALVRINAYAIDRDIPAGKLQVEFAADELDRLTAATAELQAERDYLHRTHCDILVAVNPLNFGGSTLAQVKATVASHQELQKKITDQANSLRHAADELAELKAKGGQ